MAKKKGICRNEECELYDITGKDFLQEADEFNFVCEKCGDPLFELPKKRTWWDEHGKQVMIALGAVAIIVIIVLCFRMCLGGKTDNPGEPVKNTTVVIVEPSLTTLKVGEDVTLSAKATPEGNTVSWTSSDDNVAVVSPEGKVTALKAGNADIIAQNGEAKDTVKIEVTKGGGTDTAVSIVEPTSTTLKVGESDTLSAKATPEGNIISWASSDDNVAVVSSEGKVTALKAGNADIIAQNGEAKDTVKIKVKEKGGPGDPYTVNLGYGKYTGALKNGKPEGQGRIVYTQSHRIAKYDDKGRVAQPGESVSGVFHNGEITIGKYFDTNGNLIESLNIGSVD